MKRSLVYVLGLICLQLVFLGSSFAFHMADYWPAKAGNVWKYNVEIVAISSNTQTFGSYNARRLYFGSTNCGDLCGNHVYFYLGSEGLLVVSAYDDGDTADFSATPLKLFEAEMQIGDSVISTVPAGVLDPDEFTLTATLLRQEGITVPAGTYTDTLVLELVADDSDNTWYREILWLAKGVGPVKIQRVDESPTNHEGCFFTCGAFNLDDPKTVVQRHIELEDFFNQKKGAVVIPLF